jgi:hypothetical protein
MDINNDINNDLEEYLSVWDNTAITFENYNLICHTCGAFQIRHRSKHMFYACDDINYAITIFTQNLETNKFMDRLYFLRKDKDRHNHLKHILETRKREKEEKARQHKLEIDIYGKGTLEKLIDIEQPIPFNASVTCEKVDFKNCNAFPPKQSMHIKYDFSPVQIPLPECSPSIPTPCKFLVPTHSKTLHNDHVTKPIPCTRIYTKSVSDPIDKGEDGLVFNLPQLYDCVVYRSYLEINHKNHFTKNVNSWILFNSIKRIAIVIGGQIWWTGNGIQLWAFYKALNPFAKPWEMSNFIPIPLPPHSSVLTFYHGVQVFLTPNLITLDKDKIEIWLNKRLHFLPECLVGLIIKYTQFDYSLPTFKLHRYHMTFDPREIPIIMTHREISYYQCSQMYKTTKQVSGPCTYKLDIKSTSIQACVLCIMCLNPDTGIFYNCAESRPIKNFQYIIKDIIVSDIEDESEWYENDKAKNLLNCPTDFLIYTKTFKTPIVYENPINYIITGSRREIEPNKTFKHDNDFQLIWEWSNTAKIGTEIYVWFISETIGKFREGVSGIKQLITPF